MDRKRLKVGDVVSVLHLDGHEIIGHFLDGPPRSVPLVQFYRCPPGWNLAAGLSTCEPLFPPVMVGIGHATRTGRWQILGSVEVPPLAQQQFLMTHARRGVVSPEWWLRDGPGENAREKSLGTAVPLKYRDLEVYVGWSAELIEERIVTGFNAFGYEAMMNWSNLID
jgi:hypothetical protein